MSTAYKHQEEFAASLAQRWLYGAEKPEVRRIIRGLKNKAQAAYIAASVLHAIDGKTEFLRYLHPDNKD